jgi:multiple sugar transport system substrate-binding protein
MRTLGIIAALLGLVVVGGCIQKVSDQPPASGTTATAPATGGQTELVLYTWTETKEVEANQELLAKFQEAHPEIKVTLMNVPGSTEAMAKLQTMFAGDTAPDVMSIHGAYYYAFAQKGALADLKGPIDQDKSFNLADFYPGLVEQCTYKGALCSLPRYTSVYAIFYNKALFDASGLPYPGSGPHWTWDDYLAAAKKLTRDVNGDGKPDQWGCMIDFWGARVYPWLWSNGADLMSPDRTKCVVDSPAAVEALGFLVDLRRKFVVCPESSASEKNQGLDTFAQGNIGMYMTGPWDVQTLALNESLSWDVAPVPSRKRRATMLGTENYAISAKSKHPKEAWELYKFLLSPETQTYMAEKLEKMPSRKSVAQGAYLKQSVKYNRKVFVDALSYAQQAPNIPEWDKVGKILQDHYDQVWVGKVTAREGMKGAADEVNRTLADLRSAH